MSTLFVYCSGDEAINSLCRESLFKTKNAQALQLSPPSTGSFISRLLGISRRRDYFSDYNVDLTSFDRIIIACDELAGELSSEVSDFISNNDFRYKNVDCIIFGDGRSVKKAQDSLKVQVSLSGGTVRSSLCVSSRELKRYDEDLLFSMRHRLVI